VAVDVHSGIRFVITQGTLPWQPILGAKSAKSLPLLGLIPQGMAGWESGWTH